MYHNVFDDNDTTIINGKDNVFTQFLLSEGLYAKKDITEKNIGDLIALIDGRVRISSYCTECKTERVFTMEPLTYFFESQGDYYEKKLANEIQYLQNNIYGSESEYRKENGGDWQWINWQINDAVRVMTFKFICSMNGEHHIDFVVLADDKSMCKIGQFPSVADLTFPELDIYNKVLNIDDRKNFGRAIGLFANGIGIGSYVYLRRIFERLLIQAKSYAGTTIDEDEFEKARVNEKITILTDYLPKMLTDNPAVYGILSKGIHELSEEECREYFPVLKDCIFMILDEWEEQRKKGEKEKSISSALSKIASRVK